MYEIRFLTSCNILHLFTIAPRTRSLGGMTESIWPHRMWLWFAQFIHDVSMLVQLSRALQYTVVLRGKRASARLLSSLPHYSIMMACGVCHTPSALPSQRWPLSPPTFSFLSRLPSCRLPPWRFPPRPFSLSHSSADPSWFTFLRLASYGATMERHAYTSSWRWCAWYYAPEYVKPTPTGEREKDGENKREKREKGKRESEMMRECYEEKRKGTRKSDKETQKPKE